MSYTNMALNYIVYPYVMGYIASAAFTVSGKLCDSVRRNCFFYLLYLFGATIAIILFCTSKTVQEAVQNQGPMGVLLGLSVAFAFMILAVFVGYGLVGIPMYLWRNSTFQNELDDSMVTLANLSEKLV